MIKVDMAVVRSVVSRLYADESNRGIPLSQFMHLVIDQPEVHEYRFQIAFSAVKAMIDELNKGNDITAGNKQSATLRIDNADDAQRIHNTALSILKVNQGYNVLELKQGLFGAGITVTNDEAATLYYSILEELTNGASAVMKEPVLESKHTVNVTKDKVSKKEQKRLAKLITQEDVEALQGPKPEKPVQKPAVLSTTSSDILTAINQMIVQLTQLRQENTELKEYDEKLVARHKVIDDKYIEYRNNEIAKAENRVNLELSKGPDSD